MAHPWENLVVSGVDKPRILVLGENLCTNPYLTNNLDGYTVNGATISRVENFSAYKQYMCQVEFGAETDYVEYEVDFGQAVGNKTFLIALNLVTSGEFTLEFGGADTIGTTLFDSQTYQKAFIVATFDGAETGTTVSFRIYGANDVLFDNVYFAEVLYDLEMPQPHDSGELMFRKETDGKGELWSGYTKEYNAKWIPNYSANYYAMLEVYEQYRQIISEATMLFCIPHLDYDWGFLGKWMPEEFERNYIFGQYVGHSGELSIKGQEYLNQELAIQLIVFYDVTVTAFIPD